MAFTARCSPGALDLRMTGHDRLFGLRSHIEVPMARGWRAPGWCPPAQPRLTSSCVPAGSAPQGLATVGHFRGRQAKRQWWHVYRADEVLVVDLAAESLFDRLVVQLADPRRMASDIDAARAA